MVVDDGLEAKEDILPLLYISTSVHPGVVTSFQLKLCSLLSLLSFHGQFLFHGDLLR